MQHIDQAQNHGQRVELAAIIDRRGRDIVDRWLQQVRADAAAQRVPLTDLRDGIRDYLKRIAELLQGTSSLDQLGASAWTDIARKHAITRVRLGFDIGQLFQELVTLRRVTTSLVRDELGADRAARSEPLIEFLIQIIDVAIGSSLQSYIEFRDYMLRRAEAEHIGFLTHELKNPLGAVMMAADQLRDEQLSPSQRKLSEILDRNVERIRRLIDEALLTERLQVGEVECRPVELSLRDLLGDAMDVFTKAAHDKHLELKTSFDPKLRLRADPRLTLSVIENLLDNAIKYTDEGDVRFEVEDREDMFVFHVRDQCGGLSPEELRVIFEPFKRAHSRKPGTGLGLAIARRAVEVQGGTIHAESSPEAGCHFWFTLPKTHH